jgi:hypothetical protein
MPVLLGVGSKAAQPHPIPIERNSHSEQSEESLIFADNNEF